MLDLVALELLRLYGVSNYMAPDGLMNLEPHSFREPYDEASSLKTVTNDNGILFTAYFYALLDRQGYRLTADDIEMINRALTTTRHAKHSGLYHRNDGRLDYLNSLDNYVGITALSVLIASPDAREIVDWGESHRWTFNNVNPDVWTWSAWRQPSHRLIYKLAAGVEPNSTEWAWYYTAVWVNRFLKFEQRSDLLLGWLMEWVVTKADPLEENTVRNRMVRLTVKSHGGLEALVADYFKDEQHPCRELAKGLEF